MASKMRHPTFLITNLPKGEDFFSILQFLYFLGGGKEQENLIQITNLPITRTENSDV